MSHLSILVVLYKKSISDSKSLSNLLSFSELTGKGVELIIWNNGCENSNISQPDTNIYNTYVINSKNNEQLSVIYNKVIDNHMTSDRIVIFDDDTDITLEYINDLLSNDDEVIVPEIIANDKKIYPITISNNQVVPSSINQGIKSISSGLSINHKLINRFKKIYGNVFDERFSFYGIDFSFFYRIDMLGDVKVKQSSKISHSLSRLEVKYEVNDFRWRQKIYENILMHLNYPNYNSRYLLLKVVVKLIFCFNFKTVKEAVLVFVNNRSKLYE